jgi:hypothetical protein
METQGALVALRGHVTTLVPTTATNFRAKYLKKVSNDLLPALAKNILTALDDFLLTPEAAHVAGTNMTEKGTIYRGPRLQRGRGPSSGGARGVV